MRQIRVLGTLLVLMTVMAWPGVQAEGHVGTLAGDAGGQVAQPTDILDTAGKLCISSSVPTSPAYADHHYHRTGGGLAHAGYGGSRHGAYVGAAIPGTSAAGVVHAVASTGDCEFLWRPGDVARTVVAGGGTAACGVLMEEAPTIDPLRQACGGTS